MYFIKILLFWNLIFSFYYIYEHLSQLYSLNRFNILIHFDLKLLFIIYDTMWNTIIKYPIENKNTTVQYCIKLFLIECFFYIYLFVYHSISQEKDPSQSRAEVSVSAVTYSLSVTLILYSVTVCVNRQREQKHTRKFIAMEPEFTQNTLL